MSQELILFDIPSKDGRAWSPNVWKVRAVLNYKKLPYKTEWIEFPDIAPKFKELGIPPNPEGAFAEYTVPVVKFPDGSYIMDSTAIVPRLEAVNPEPPLPLELDLLKELEPINGKVLGPLVPLIMPAVRRDVLCKESDAWFKKDRERRLGAPEEVYEREKGGEVAWKGAEPGQQQLASFLKAQKRDEGPFILGSAVSYPDFVLAGRVEFIRFIGEDNYERLVRPVEGLRELHEACKPWFERNDH